VIGKIKLPLHKIASMVRRGIGKLLLQGKNFFYCKLDDSALRYVPLELEDIIEVIFLCIESQI